MVDSPTMSLMIEGGLTDTQLIVLSFLYVFSSILSIVGSSTILYKVLGDFKNSTSYDRVMVGLSTFDVIASLGWALTPFLLPKETSMRPWAIGNNATCTLLGFITQLGFSAVLYNMFLSFYYLLTVRYGVKRIDFGSKYEVWIHGFCIVFALITAVTGATTGMFSEVQVGFGCWVNNYPPGCTDDCISLTIGWVFGGGPIVVTLMALTVNNILVYFHVRRSFLLSTISTGSARDTWQSLQKREVAQQGFLYVASFLLCFCPAAATRGIEAFSPVSREAEMEERIVWLLMIQATTLPLQGFLNMFIYNRPNYSRLRAAYPELTLVAALWKACFDRNIPRLQEITLSSSRPPSFNKYRDATSSGAAFQSDLSKIHEEGESAYESSHEIDDVQRTGAMSLSVRSDFLDGGEDIRGIQGSSGPQESFSTGSSIWGEIPVSTSDDVQEDRSVRGTPVLIEGTIEDTVEADRVKRSEIAPAPPRSPASASKRINMAGSLQESELDNIDA